MYTQMCPILVLARVRALLMRQFMEHHAYARIPTLFMMLRATHAYNNVQHRSRSTNNMDRVPMHTNVLPFAQLVHGLRISTVLHHVTSEQVLHIRSHHLY